jgi:hypothetical protein
MRLTIFAGYLCLFVFAGLGSALWLLFRSGRANR